MGATGRARGNPNGSIVQFLKDHPILHPGTDFGIQSHARKTAFVKPVKDFIPSLGIPISPILNVLGLKPDFHRHGFPSCDSGSEGSDS